MFFKMLKSDLKRSRGLNLILFIFMIAAAAFVFVGTAQVYAVLTQNERTEMLCNSSDFIGIVSIPESERKEKMELFSAELDKFDALENVEFKEYIPIDRFTVGFKDFDVMSDKMMMNDCEFLLSSVPTGYDSVITTDDETLHVPNGCIAVPVTISKRTGAKLGDKIRLTTDIGNVYELEISSFIKDPLNEEAFVYRYFISDADYELLAEEFPVKQDFGSFKSSAAYFDTKLIGTVWDKAKELKIGFDPYPSKMTDLNTTKIILIVLSVFIVVISIFIILIIFMTIRFTIIAALKNEEREIGVMRAVGVDSFGFRWLFIAKYIALAIIGGVVGLFIGAPSARLLMNMFSENYACPDAAKMNIIGIIGVAVNVLVIILFSLGVMRRINKISVIDAIHGENRGERFGKTSALTLSGRKKMSVPAFLALSDIITRLKRYIFPIIAYTLSMMILLLVFNLRHSVMSNEFMKYLNFYQYDFLFYFSNEDNEALYRRAEKNGVTVEEQTNNELREHGIPAEVKTLDIGFCYLINGDEKDIFTEYLHAENPDTFKYRKGSHHPVLENEVSMSYFTANKKGLNLGDTITLEVEIKDETKTSYVKEKREYVITGFFDFLESGSPVIALGGEQEDIFVASQFPCAFVINAPEKEHGKVISQMQELYGKDSVLTPKDGMRLDMARYDELLGLLEYVMGGLLLFITILITYLYQNIFIAEETSEIAMLKSVGFSDGSIKLWQVLRMLFLAVISVVFAHLIFRTAGVAAARTLFKLLSLSGFGFLFEFPVSFLLIPMLFTGAILAVTYFKSRRVDSIAVWDISNE